MQSKKRKTSLGDRVDLDNVLSTHFSFHFVSFLFLSVVSYIQLKTLMQLDFLFFLIHYFQIENFTKLLLFLQFLLCFVWFVVLLFLCMCVCVLFSLFFWSFVEHSSNTTLCICHIIHLKHSIWCVCPRTVYTMKMNGSK